MPRRRITRRTLGAAAGGLLSVAFLPGAIAFADGYEIDPTGTETITGLYGTGLFGAFVTPPALEGSIQGDQLFKYTDTTTGGFGTFMGDASTDSNNEEVLVTSVGTGADAPPVGSVFDTYNYGYGFESIYSAIPTTGGGADTLSQTMMTPFGDYTVPMTFDAADVQVADAAGIPLADGDTFVPTGTSTITAINGDPPLTMLIQGDQTFDAAGVSGGSFGADETTTADGLGTYTEAVLVTSNNHVAGDPAVGSIFNTINYGGIENIYSDLTSATPGGPDTLSDTLVTPFGDFSIPVTFDAVAAETPVSIDVPDGAGMPDALAGDDIVAAPGHPEVFTGVNGLPPGDVAVQGQQEFDLDKGSTVLGTFDADETKTLDLFGDTTQTLLVTKDLGDSLPAGSAIETVSLGSGFENIYIDIASTTPGADVISDTLVTPFGDIAIPNTLDAVAGLATDMFQILGSL